MTYPWDVHRMCIYSVWLLGTRFLLAPLRDGASLRRLGIEPDMTFPGQDYLTGYALPQVYFHPTTTFDILLQNGIVIGKRDY